MKPLLEKVLVDQGSSWSAFHRHLESFPFEWHYHPEFELTMTLNSVGQRYIGDYIGSYDHGDLILMGPNLPHTWCSQAKIEPQRPHEGPRGSSGPCMPPPPKWLEPFEAMFADPVFDI